ncbi:hypothetical protein [Erysipelothrix aquatica]|uniref:hypothetical protein n=1 Tax=Erysipelothrix aquatica TaxID=2683714 RepID=UPI001356E07C|nr:hypothetical protein [Erysipelothrix aquatica]
MNILVGNFKEGIIEEGYPEDFVEGLVATITEKVSQSSEWLTMDTMLSDFFGIADDMSELDEEYMS